MLYFSRRRSVCLNLPMPPPGFDALTVEEQIDYVQSLWDHIAAHPDQVPVPDWHKEILAERLAAYRTNPSEGKTWEEFEEKIRKLTRQIK